jgi:hypothetical protein
MWGIVSEQAVQAAIMKICSSGIVKRARWRGRSVAIKTVHDHCANLAESDKEVGHARLCRGIVTQSKGLFIFRRFATK